MKIQKIMPMLALATGLFVFALLTAGCLGTATPSATPEAGNTSDPNSVMWRFTRGLMTSADLPPGWSHRRDFVQNDRGGIGRGVIYYGDDPERLPLVSVNQVIVICRDDQAAEEVYRRELPIYIPPEYGDKYGHPTGLEAPRHADESGLYCHPVNIDGKPAQACVVVARYGDMFTATTGHVFGDRWITMPQFAHLVDRVDERMESARRP